MHLPRLVTRYRIHDTMKQDLITSNESRRTGQKRVDRPHALTSEEVDRIVQKIKNNGWPIRMLQWKQLTHACGLEVCTQDVLRNIY